MRCETPMRLTLDQPLAAFAVVEPGQTFSTAMLCDTADAAEQVRHFLVTRWKTVIDVVPVTITVTARTLQP